MYSYIRACAATGGRQGISSGKSDTDSGGFRNPRMWIVRAYAKLYDNPIPEVLAETGSREKRRLKHVKRTRKPPAGDRERPEGER